MRHSARYFAEQGSIQRQFTRKPGLRRCDYRPSDWGLCRGDSKNHLSRKAPSRASRSPPQFRHGIFVTGASLITASTRTTRYFAPQCGQYIGAGESLYMTAPLWRRNMTVGRVVPKRMKLRSMSVRGTKA